MRTQYPTDFVRSQFDLVKRQNIILAHRHHYTPIGLHRVVVME